MKTVKENLEAQYFATGVQLDKFGELYGVHHIVESDVEYRLRFIWNIRRSKWKTRILKMVMS